MALGDSDTGFGVAVTFQSGLLAKIRNIDMETTRDSVDVTHAGSSNNAMDFIPQAFYDAGTISGTLVFDPQGDWKTAIKAASETVTLTYPNVGSTAASDAASGFLTRIGRAVPYDDVMTAECEIKLTGDITYTTGT